MWNYLYLKILECSGLSNLDYIMLVGHYARLTNGTVIDQSIYDRGYTEQQLKVLEERYEERAKGTTVRLLNFEFSGLLDKFNYDQFDYVLSLFSAYDKNGILPFPGSLSEQPAQVMDIFSILHQIQFESQMRTKAEHEREVKKQQQKRNTRVRS